MKRSLLFLLLLTFGLCQSQIVNIPDANFKYRLVNEICADSNDDGFLDSDVDSNNDGEIQESEALAINGKLALHLAEITDLTGIEAFTNLKNLFCPFNNITSLDLSNNINLEEVRCMSNEITNIDITQNTNLVFLNCGDNQLSNLDISQNINLTDLLIYVDDINLDLSNNINLIRLTIGGQFLDIDLSQNLLLQKLALTSNQITSLDLSSQSELIQLFIQNSPNLEYVNIQNGNNHNIQADANNIDFSNLPNLETVCVDDENSTFVDDLIAFYPDLSSVSFVDDCRLSIDENHLLNFSFYPNPMKDELNIITSSNIKGISIYNSLGQLVLERRNQNSINTSSLSQGLYFVKIENTFSNTEIIKVLKN